MSDQTDPTMRIPRNAAGRRRAGTGAVIPIPVDQLTLGRDADQIGQLGGDPTISRLHASELEKAEDSSVKGQQVP